MKDLRERGEATVLPGDYEERLPPHPNLHCRSCLLRFRFPLLLRASRGFGLCPPSRFTED